MKRLTAPQETELWIAHEHHLGGGVRFLLTDDCPPSLGDAIHELAHGRCEQHAICMDCALGIAASFLHCLREQRTAPQPTDPIWQCARDLGVEDVDDFVEDFGELFAAILAAVDEVR